MKKLMILAAGIALACSVHAVQYTWGLGSGDYQDNTGTFLDKGTAFFYLGTVSATDSAFDFSKATYIDKSGFDGNYYGYGKMDTTDLQSSDLITKTDADQAYSIVLVDHSVTTLDGYEGYYTIVSDKSLLGTIPGSGSTPTTYYADFANFTASAYTTSYMSAVPEPTSGLLLLLGVAGLALRRRRA